MKFSTILQAASLGSVALALPVTLQDSALARRKHAAPSHTAQSSGCLVPGCYNKREVDEPVDEPIEVPASKPETILRAPGGPVHLVGTQLHGRRPEELEKPETTLRAPGGPAPSGSTDLYTCSEVGCYNKRDAEELQDSALARRKEAPTSGETDVNYCDVPGCH
ncbi:hypothetical protein LX36DRAFT_384099 [Colletotrichum falcatum]|nr:hypothetical protein LX36DRAFT_384099 [Colletotrichum falcatum]